MGPLTIAGFVWKLLGRKGEAPAWVGWVGMIFAILALLAAARGAWAVLDWFNDRDAIERDRMKGNIEQLEKQQKAGERAAGERLENAGTNRDQEEAYEDAIHHPDPDDDDSADVRLACEQLRRAGQDTAGIPGCGGR